MILIFAKKSSLQWPGNLVQVLIIGHCIVSSNNGLVFNILMSRILAFFKIKSAIFYGFLKFSRFDRKITARIVMSIDLFLTV